MNNLSKISLTFIRRSKAFVISCMISICFSVLFINSVYNLSENVINSYNKALLEDYGDYQISITKPKYLDFDSAITSEIDVIEGIHTLSQGRFDTSVLVEGMETYLVSVMDDDVMKSRYHYSSDLSDKQIIINSILAEVLKKEVGDYLTIHDNKLEIIEIIGDKIYDARSMAMAFISYESHELIFDKEYHSNFAMIKLDPRVMLSDVMDRIQAIDTNINVDAIELDENYQGNLTSMKAYIIVLGVFVLMISCLFIIGIMNLFLYKYLHDIAIMRAIGGDMVNIKKIFVRIIEYLVGSACVLGYLLSILLNKVMLEYINTELNLIKGRIVFYYGKSFLVSFGIFVVIYLFLRLTLHKSEEILPIQALLDNEVKKAGKRKKEPKHSTLHFYRRLWRDWFLAGKLILPKLKENILIIATFSMIIAFALVGGSLHTVIQKNNSNYMKSQYLTDIVVTTSKHMSLEEGKEVRDTLMQQQNILASLVSEAGLHARIMNDDRVVDTIEYRLATIDSIYHQHIINHEVKNNDSIVVSEKLAKELNLEIGSNIIVESPILYGRDAKGYKDGIIRESRRYEFEVGNILKNDQMKFIDMFIDLSYDDFTDPMIGFDCMFVSGNQVKATELLNELRLKHAGLKWSNYQDMIEYSNKVIKERFFMMEIVIEFLIVIAGIGWYNSMRAIIISHKKNYMYLRIQGTSGARIIKIISIQMFYYMISGIVIGAMIGFAALFLLGIVVDQSLIHMMNPVLLHKVVWFLSILCILQYPTMKQVSSIIDLKLYN